MCVWARWVRRVSASPLAGCQPLPWLISAHGMSVKYTAAVRAIGSNSPTFNDSVFDADVLNSNFVGSPVCPVPRAVRVRTKSKTGETDLGGRHLQHHCRREDVAEIDIAPHDAA